MRGVVLPCGTGVPLEVTLKGVFNIMNMSGGAAEEPATDGRPYVVRPSDRRWFCHPPLRPAGS